MFQTHKEVVMFNYTREVGTLNLPEVPQNVHKHMGSGGTPLGFFANLGLTDQEVDEIVAFLETLTDGYQTT